MIFYVFKQGIWIVVQNIKSQWKFQQYIISDNGYDVSNSQEGS